MTYGTFVIDPPWPKKKGGLRASRPNQGRLLDYDTLSVPEIFDMLDLVIFPTADPTHTVFLWCVEEFLMPAETEMLRRGYRRHIRLIWDKTNGVAPAFSVRFSHEYLVWFYKPKFTPVDEAVRGKYTSVLSEKARQHSRKPDGAYDLIRKLYPDVRRLDVFSRETREGWDSWGDQTGHFDP